MAVEIGFVGYAHSPVPVAVVPSEEISCSIVVEAYFGVYHTFGRIVEIVLVGTAILFSVEFYVAVYTEGSVTVNAVNINVLFLTVMKNLYVIGIYEVYRNICRNKLRSVNPIYSVLNYLDFKILLVVVNPRILLCQQTV